MIAFHCHGNSLEGVCIIAWVNSNWYPNIGRCCTGGWKKDHFKTYNTQKYRKNTWNRFTHWWVLQIQCYRECPQQNITCLMKLSWRSRLTDKFNLHNNFGIVFVFPHQIFENLVSPPSLEKILCSALYINIHKWGYQINLEADRSQQVSQEKGLKSYLLSLKMYINVL